MFDEIAPRYDFLNHFLSAGIDRRWRKRAIRSLRLTGREVVLDLCCGTGDLAIEAVSARPRAARVLGVDFSPVMVAFGMNKLRRRQMTRDITLALGDASRIPAADQVVDAVTIGFGIRNVDDRAEACREMYRVLKRGGRLAILDFGLPTAPLFRRLYLSYFRHVLPRLGRWISGSATAYTYLPESVGVFESDAFMNLLRTAGFDEVAADPMMFGSVFLYTARRSS
jgi:demethylmenaquinone methyltransferase/2-methoxy-6-polyprenyl-1,4-benzoquinol methylase